MRNGCSMENSIEKIKGCVVVTSLYGTYAHLENQSILLWTRYGSRFICPIFSSLLACKQVDPNIYPPPEAANTRGLEGDHCTAYSCCAVGSMVNSGCWRRAWYRRTLPSAPALKNRSRCAHGGNNEQSACSVGMDMHHLPLDVQQ
eukprot:scaffold210315_cov19-Tisochrysis_lutea.AAC.1